MPIESLGEMRERCPHCEAEFGGTAEDLRRGIKNRFADLSKAIAHLLEKQDLYEIEFPIQIDQR
jgi:hypothetical protein